MANSSGIISALCILACFGFSQARKKPQAPTLQPIQIDSAGPGPRPWTHTRFDNNPDNFRFAVMGDNSGGTRAGVLDKAVTALNRLRPEFVLSVGDYIEGYTTERAAIESEWKAFDSSAGKLTMPFFRVPGNHDISNATMDSVWAKRYGPSSYSFVYRGVLFIALSTQDSALHTLTRKNIEWLRGILAANPSPRWTVLFVHTPLWHSDKAPTPWTPIDSLLTGRKHTVFAGHEHVSLYEERNGGQYYTLPVTGGGSSLRGAEKGEFDGVIWAGMNGDTMEAALVEIDAIHPGELRTNSPTLKNLAQVKIITRPVIRKSPQEHRWNTHLTIENPLSAPIAFSLNPGVPEGLVFSASVWDTVIAPAGRIEIPIDLELNTSLASAKDCAAPFSSEIHFVDSPSVVLHQKRAFSAVVEHSVGAVDSVVVDGVLSEWTNGARWNVVKGWHGSTFNRATNTLLHYRGTQDLRARYSVAMADSFLVVAVEVRDEQVLSQYSKNAWEQDGIELRIDSRPRASRDGAATTDDNPFEVLGLFVSPSTHKDSVWVYQTQWYQIPATVQIACVQTPGGYTAEFAIPLRLLSTADAQGFTDIRFNLAINDLDTDGQSQLWLFPDWRTPQNIPGSGTFVLNK